MSIGGNGNFTLFGPGGSSSGSGGGGNLTVNTYSSGPQTLTTSNQVVLLDGTSAGFTVNLYTAVGNSGAVLYLKRTDNTLANVITIDANGAETIDDSLTITLNTQYEEYTLVSNGSGWNILNHKATTDWTNAGTNTIHSTAEYTFTISSATIVNGDTYTNNGQTFTVTTNSGTVTSLATYGTGAPAASGTLTRASGSGPATLTFSAVTTSLPVKGTTSTDIIWWRRVGSNIECRIEYQQTAAGTAGSGDYLFGLPANISLDITKLTKTSSAAFGQNSLWKTANSVGSFGIQFATNTNGVGPVVVHNAQYVRFPVIFNNTSSVGNTGGAGSVQSPLSATSWCLAVTFSAPVSGWVA